MALANSAELVGLLTDKLSLTFLGGLLCKLGVIEPLGLRNISLRDLVAELQRKLVESMSVGFAVG